MKYLYHLFTLCFSLACIASCTPVISRINAHNSGVRKVWHFKDTTNGKEAVMIGTVHAAKPSYYEQIKTLLDSLKKDDYVVFYEGVGVPSNIDSLVYDTLQRKFRRVVGLKLTGDYTDPKNKSIGKIVKKKKYVPQTIARLGTTTSQDIRVDYMFTDLIAQYEKDKGPIVLTPYDFETGLLEKYEPKDTAEYDSYHLMHNLREDYVIEAVKESEHSKIVLLYGKGHWYFLLAGLRNLGYIRMEE